MKNPRNALIALTLLNLLNYLDRQAVSTLYPTIQHDLHLSDTQLGLLSTVCLLVMAIASVPFGHVADRKGERGVVMSGVAAWCIGTVTAARALTFNVMAGARALVGLGEAAYEPAANAFICNELAPQAKAKALAIFNAGTVLGLAAGLAGTGYFAAHFGWRRALLAIGLAGLPFLFVASRLPSGPPEHAHSRQSFLVLLRRPALAWALAGGVCATFAAGGILNWTITFLVRFHGYTEKSAGASVGAVAIGCGLTGILLSGWVSDHMDRWRGRGEGRALGIALPIGLAAVPIGLAILSPSLWGFWAGAAVGMVLCGAYNGPSAALIDELAPPGQEAAAQGLLLFTIHLLGDTPSPTVIGWISDHSNLRLALLVSCVALAASGGCFAMAARAVRAERQPALGEPAGRTAESGTG